jgi:hypothetical protein
VNAYEFPEKAACDIWLLNEVPNALTLDGAVHRSTPQDSDQDMGCISGASGTRFRRPHNTRLLPRQFWTASSCAVASCRGGRTGLLAATGSIVCGWDWDWDWDWNHALHERKVAGTNHGRSEIEKLRFDLQLQIPTEHLPSPAC